MIPNNPRDVPVIGLTGPTGSGKSTVAAVWQQHGAALIDADALAREVTAAAHPCLAELAAAFSPDILNPDGTLNRARLAALAFADEEHTALLSAITHPHILALCRARIKEWQAAEPLCVVLDAPLLFESGLHRDCDKTLAVLAPANLRLARICSRDGIAEQAARARMSAQPDDAFYTARATHVLYNHGDLAALQTAAKELLPWLSSSCTSNA